MVARNSTVLGSMALGKKECMCYKRADVSSIILSSRVRFFFIDNGRNHDLQEKGTDCYDVLQGRMCQLA